VTRFGAPGDVSNVVYSASHTMRTVSFSSPAVLRVLNSRFENTFLNTTRDSSAGSSVGHAPSHSANSCSRGLVNQTVHCLFITPKGRLFHTSSGFRNSGDLLVDLQFALNTLEAIQKSPAEGPRIVALVHKQRLLDGTFSEEQIRRPASWPLAHLTSLNYLIGLIGTLPLWAPLSTVEGVVAARTRQAELADGLFMRTRPSLPFSEFRRNPRQLTGNEPSAFPGTSDGSVSGSKIGN
jgi:hypothetical protein